MIEHQFDYFAPKYFDKIFSSISILCRPVVVRKVFLMVEIVVLANHSLNVLNTKAAVATVNSVCFSVSYEMSYNNLSAWLFLF